MCIVSVSTVALATYTQLVLICKVQRRSAFGHLHFLEPKQMFIECFNVGKK